MRILNRFAGFDLMPIVINTIEVTVKWVKQSKYAPKSQFSVFP